MALLSASSTQVQQARHVCKVHTTSAPRVGCVHQPARQTRSCTHAPILSRHGSVGRTRITAGVASGASIKQQDVLVEEVMNPKPVLLQQDMSIKDAVHTMLDANIAGAPVVNATGQIVGVLSEADVIWKGVGKPEDHFIIPPVYIGALDAYVFLRDNKAFEEETHKVLARTVADAMVAKDKVVTIKPSALMSDAAHQMLHHEVNLLPVVEEDGTVVGIVTRHDILRGIYASKNPLL